MPEITLANLDWMASKSNDISNMIPWSASLSAVLPTQSFKSLDIFFNSPHHCLVGWLFGGCGCVPALSGSFRFLVWGVESQMSWLFGGLMLAALPLINSSASLTVEKKGMITQSANVHNFNKHTIKVCVSCSWQCPRTSAPHVSDGFLTSLQFQVQRMHQGPLEGAVST